MIKAYIIIELENGRSIKYVRDVVTDNDGDSEAYYGYGDTAGDSFGSQGGDSGKVGYDFEDIVSNSTGDSWLYSSSSQCFFTWRYGKPFMQG